MDFKQFYKEIIFDIDNNMNTLYSAKQGDTKSRGFYVALTQNNIVVPVTTQTMTFYAEKPDGTRVFQNAEKDGDKFRIDLTNQVFAVKGIVKCELALRGGNGEKISSKTFRMTIEEQLVDDSIMSTDDIAIVDNALDLLAGYEGDITTVTNNLVAHKAESASMHIRENGGNANGRYIKFDDGTMICYIPEISAVGTGTNATQTAWTFPAPFTSINYAISSTPTKREVNGAAVSTASYTIHLATKSLTQIGVLRFISPTVISSDTVMFASITAIGRWKQ